jgi:hypothetical protein
MKLKPFQLCTALLLTLAGASAVQAESLRCKGDLAQVGDSKASVLQKCGEPILKDWHCKPATPPEQSGNATGTTAQTVPCERVEEWSYNPGPGQFITILRFEAGELQSIKYGDRVK